MKKETYEDPLARERDLGGKRYVRRRTTGKVLSAEAVEPRNIKVQISIKLDADVLEHFKRRASRPGAAAYQTQINQALREAMQRDEEEFPGAALLRDERFVEALAERVKSHL
jgi:uncharacterized protein (DUF4415 family)